MSNDFDCTNSCERNYDKENFNNLLVPFQFSKLVCL
jgi:hypothetical protein